MEDFKIEVFRDEEIDYRKLGKLLYRGFFIVEKDKKFVITDEYFNVITKGMFDEIKPAFRYHFWGRMNEHWKLYNMEFKVKAFSNQICNYYVPLDSRQNCSKRQHSELLLE